MYDNANLADHNSASFIHLLTYSTHYCIFSAVNREYITYATVPWKVSDDFNTVVAVQQSVNLNLR